MNREQESTSVLLQDEADNRRLSLEIGPFEANALIIELESIRMPRPLTHDIIAQLMKRHGFAIRYIELTRRQDGGYGAFLFYTHDREKYSLSLRPSDALVLAAKTGASVYMREEEFNKCGAEETAVSGFTETGDCELLFSRDNDGSMKLM